MKGKGFAVGIGGLNYADTLLFRALGLPSIKLSEEDIEAYTLQTRLGMPVYSTQDPSKQVWSRFHHSELPDPDTLAYRWVSFKSYLLNWWQLMGFQSEMLKVVDNLPGGLDTRIDAHDSMIIG